MFGNPRECREHAEKCLEQARSAPTLLVMSMSDAFVKYWWLIFGVLFGGGYAFMQTWKRSEKMQFAMLTCGYAPSVRLWSAPPSYVDG